VVFERRSALIAFVTGYSTGLPTGLERSLIDLLKALDERPIASRVVIYTRRGNGLHSVLQQEGIQHLRVQELGFGKAWRIVGLLLAPRATAYFWNNLQAAPVLFKPKRSGVLIYDFAYKSFGDSSLIAQTRKRSQDVFARRCLARAQTVVAISQATKDEAVHLYGVSPDKITVVYPGVNDRRSVAPKKPFEISEYFLFVGSLKERKNPLAVVRAFYEFKSRGDRAEKLVIVGKGAGAGAARSEYVRAIECFIEDHSLGQDVILTGYVTDAELSYLYRHTKALVFPSRLEGFGFPVAEAHVSGVPVITSTTSSLPEVAGGAALLVHPDDIDALADALEQVGESEVRDTLVANGREQVKKFSWEKTAEGIERVLESF
jgi:glycosyltransferase involved in cell wall biosynthesis